MWDHVYVRISIPCITSILHIILITIRLLWNHGTTILSLAINILMLVTWNAKASLDDYKKMDDLLE